MKEGNKKCNIEVGFNGAGNPIYFCLVHGKQNNVYHRLEDICVERLSKKLKKMIK